MHADHLPACRPPSAQSDKCTSPKSSKQMSSTCPCARSQASSKRSRHRHSPPSRQEQRDRVQESEQVVGLIPAGILAGRQGRGPIESAELNLGRGGDARMHEQAKLFVQQPNLLCGLLVSTQETPRAPAFIRRRARRRCAAQMSEIAFDGLPSGHAPAAAVIAVSPGPKGAADNKAVSPERRRPRQAGHAPARAHALAFAGLRTGRIAPASGARMSRGMSTAISSSPPWLVPTKSPFHQGPGAANVACLGVAGTGWRTSDAPLERALGAREPSLVCPNGASEIDEAEVRGRHSGLGVSTP